MRNSLPLNKALQHIWQTRPSLLFIYGNRNFMLQHEEHKAYKTMIINVRAYTIIAELSHAKCVQQSTMGKKMW